MGGLAFGLGCLVECPGDEVVWTDTRMNRRFFGNSMATVEAIESSVIQQERVRLLGCKTLRTWGENGQTIGCPKWFWRDWDGLVTLVATRIEVQAPDGWPLGYGDP